MSFKKRFSTMLLLGFLLSSAAAQAQNGVFRIVERQFTGAAAGGPGDQFFDEFENNVNQNLPDVEPGKYTKGMANAAAMAGTGTTAVYGASFGYALVGAGLGLGVDLGEGNSLSDVLSGNFDAETLGGFGAQGAAVLGINPGAFYSKPIWFIDPSQLRFYLSFFRFSQSFQENAELEFSNFGVMAQYRIIPDRSLGMNMLKWNGVDVSTGLRYSKFKFEASVDISEPFEDDNGSTAEFDGTATIGADVGVFTIPLEVSTSVRGLYFLNLVTGFGADINFGSSKAISSLDGQLNANFSGAGTASGEAELDLGGTSGPTITNMRGFLGTQIEFGVGSLYFTVQRSLTAGVYGINTGLNFFW